MQQPPFSWLPFSVLRTLLPLPYLEPLLVLRINIRIEQRKRKRVTYIGSRKKSADRSRLCQILQFLQHLPFLLFFFFFSLNKFFSFFFHVYTFHFHSPPNQTTMLLHIYIYIPSIHIRNCFLVFTALFFFFCFFAFSLPFSFSTFFFLPWVYLKISDFLL